MIKLSSIQRLWIIGVWVSLATFGVVISQEHLGSPPNKPTPTLDTVVVTPKAQCYREARVSIFMYHYIRKVIPTDARIIVQLSVDPKVFRSHMEMVRNLTEAKKVALLTSDELISAEQTKCYPNKNVFVFSVDDGWIDSYTELAPIAREFKVPFTFGIITDRLGTDVFMTKSLVKELSSEPLFTIASHSLHHDDQDTMPELTERRTVCESRKILESMTWKTIQTYIFPAGRMSPRSGEILKSCGYKLGLSTSFWEAWDKRSSLLGINRVRVFPESTPRYFERFVETKQKDPSQGHHIYFGGDDGNRPRVQ